MYLADISVMILNFCYEHFLKCNFRFIVCVYKPLSLNQWQKWLSLTNTHISGIVVKFGLFCRTLVFFMITFQSDMTLFPQLLFRQCLTNTSEQTSGKWSCLRRPMSCCCCLLCSSLTAARHNSFYFPFVVDKHDFEPSYRCMCTHKALSTDLCFLAFNQLRGGRVSVGRK